MAAAVAVAPDDVRKRRHAQLDPARARGIAQGEHPVADGEHRAALEQLAREPRHLACRALAAAVVKLHRLAVHRADPQEVEMLFAALGAGAGAVGERRREADALETIEIDLKHLQSEASGGRREGTGADRRQASCRNERCKARREGGAGFERLRCRPAGGPVRSYARIRRLPTRRQEQSQAWSWT